MRHIDNGRESARVLHLAVRQLQVLALVVQGKTNREVSVALRMERTTVRSHVSDLLQGTGCINRTALASWVGEHPGVLEHGRAAVGAHPRNCTCGFSYCPEGQATA